MWHFEIVSLNNTKAYIYSLNYFDCSMKLIFKVFCLYGCLENGFLGIMISLYKIRMVKLGINQKNIVLLIIFLCTIFTISCWLIIFINESEPALLIPEKILLSQDTKNENSSENDFKSLENDHKSLENYLKSLENDLKSLENDLKSPEKEINNIPITTKFYI